MGGKMNKKRFKNVILNALLRRCDEIMMKKKYFA